MISEITFEGFRFFKDSNDLSFFADSRTKRLLSNATELDGRRVLKAVGVYGPNNSGKSNLVNLFSLLKKVLLGDLGFACNRAVFGDSSVASFSITFNNNDGKGWFRYDFSYDSVTKRFLKEKLTSIKYYQDGSPFLDVKFEKDVENKRFSVFGEDNSNLLSLISSTRPILYSLELESGKFAPLADFRDSLKKAADSIEIVKPFNIPISKTIEFMKNGDDKKRQFILAFMKDADLSVKDFCYNKKAIINDGDKDIDEKVLLNNPEAIEGFHLQTTYGTATVPSLLFDSSGTKKIEALASYIYEALSEGKTLVIDELDNSLHFRLTRAIVGVFNNLANARGQLLFTAHDFLLIDCKNLLRKDQIYFLQRDAKGARLYCLKEAIAAEGGPREGSNLIKRYNHGDFGAVPSPDFINEIITIRDKKE